MISDLKTVFDKESIHLDFETYSEVDLLKQGAFRYAMDKSTEVLICAYAFGDGPLHVWLPWCQPVPQDLMRAVKREGVTINAHNSQFEYVIWNHVLLRIKDVPYLESTKFSCTAARAAACGLPRALEKLGTALYLRNRKGSKGKEFINFFSKPRKPTKNNPDTRNHPKDYPEKFEGFIQYCKDDVRVEREVDKRVPPLSRFERKVFALDAVINERGLPVDLTLLRKTRAIVQELERRTKTRVRQITKGINPTQRDKLMEWLNTKLAEYDIELENLQARTLRRLLKLEKIELSTQLEELILLRLEASRVSTRKIDAMLRVATDGRLRGTSLYYGAHTGRWAGKLVQPHNYIRGTLKPHQQRAVFDLLSSGDPDLLQAVYKYPLDTIAQCLRGFIRPDHDHTLMVVDYKAIEACVLAWLAGDTELVKAFQQGVDVYKLMAVKVYGLNNVDEVTDEQRRIAKQIVLGCGYGMGAEKFVIYCDNQDIFIELPFAKLCVNTYREERWKIKKYWKDVENAVIEAMQSEGQTIKLRNLSFKAVRECGTKYLSIILPSGRPLRYPYPKLDLRINKFGNEQYVFSYRTMWKQAVWLRNSSYGAKIVENIVQAVARDLLAQGLINADKENHFLIGTVHDEAIAEIEKRKATEKAFKKFMDSLCRLPEWAEGCPVNGEGAIIDWYRKA